MLADLCASSMSALPSQLGRAWAGRLRRLMPLLAVAASMAACGPATAPRQAASAVPAVTGATPNPAVLAPGAPPASAKKVEITFVDLDSFDKSVEKALASGAPEVEVKLLAGMSPNQIAPRLGRWINTVQDNGGDVQVTGAPRTRSLGLLASLGELIYKAWNDARLQGLVKGVDAEMAMNGDKIQAVTFRRR